MGLQKSQDPPFDRVQSVWAARAPVDAFVHVAHFIDEISLNRLEAAITQVFSQVVEPPSPEEVFSFDRKSVVQHSRWLRDGLATTLLMIAALGDEAEMQINGSTPQHFVDRVVKNIPGLRDDPRLIMSLSEQFPLLAEAAPGPLLDALEHLLKGEHVAVEAFFKNDDELFAPRSPHIELLWAMETLAWSPVYLARVAQLLVKLAKIDPGGKTMNRPINSLRSIFLSWSPNTHASIDIRLGILTSLVKSNDAVGWEMIVKLLPKRHDSSSPTHKPMFKEFGGSELKTLTYGDIWKSSSRVVDLLLELSGDSVERWCEVVVNIDNFEKEDQKKAVNKIEEYLEKSPAESVLLVWEKLHDELNRHKAFCYLDWTMKGDEIDRIEVLVNRFMPSDPMIRVKWLFDDWSPNIPDTRDADEILISKMRREALQDIFTSNGAASILDFAKKVKFPEFVAEATIDIVSDLEILLQMIESSYDDNPQLNSFASNLSQHARRKYASRWVVSFRKFATINGWQASKTAYLLLGWPDEKSTWENVAEFGIATESEYWKRKRGFPLKLDTEDVQFAVEKYLANDQAIKAVCAMHYAINEMPVEFILKALDKSVSEINASPNEFTSITSHYFEEAFDSLASRSDVSKMEVAQREYAYLALLRHRNKSLTIHLMMAANPGFFVQVLNDAYKADNADTSVEKVTDEMRRRATASYEILSSFEVVPGQTTEGIDQDRLRKWVSDARNLSAIAQRSTISDIFIGQLLAHAKSHSEDAPWPPVEICEVLQELDAPDILRGVQTERFNMRGVYSKAMQEGGEQERELAAKYRLWSNKGTAWPKVSSMLVRIAEQWDDSARDADMRAEKQKMRF